MGSFRSKEDDVAKISTSIFASNFPDSVSAKDLFHSCKQYGHVMDSFIPMKRLKDGKRFGFVRFINVFNVERLVNNLCTIWLNRCKLHANIARFNRDQKNGNKYKTANQKKHEGRKNTFYDPSKEAGTFDSRNSFVNVLKGTNMVKETDSSPVIVLEEDCLNSKDLSNSLIGRVKDVGSLSNLKKVLCNEGVGSWFSVLRQASHDFTPEGRIAWVKCIGFELKKLPAGYPSSPNTKRMMIILNRNSSAVNSRILVYILMERIMVLLRCLKQFYRNTEWQMKERSRRTNSVEKNGSKSKDDQVQNISDNQLQGNIKMSEIYQALVDLSKSHGGTVKVKVTNPRSKKASWVNWNKVLTAKEKGGLGVSSLYALNRGLMCKWVWRFFAHKSLLWSRVIKAIHGPEGGLITDVRRVFDHVNHYLQK
ncbi:nucleotide-binding alpha-beta plait domain-containing protein [Tanacetum coccineum]